MAKAPPLLTVRAARRLSRGTRPARAAARRSYQAPASWASAFSVGSLLSFASAGSVASVASLLSVGSSGSVLSIGSAGSVLSIGSAGSVLSIGSAGSVLGIGAGPTGRDGDGDRTNGHGRSSTGVAHLATLAGLGALAAAMIGR